MNWRSNEFGWCALVAFIVFVFVSPFIMRAVGPIDIPLDGWADRGEGPDRFRVHVAFAVAVCLAFEAAAVAGAVLVPARPGDPFRTGVVWGCYGGAALGLLGFVMSQFAPFSGGFVETYMTGPFSAPRLMAMPTHVLALGIGGVVVGGGAGALRAHRPA